MIQVLKHDYGKGSVSREKIRQAVEAVLARRQISKRVSAGKNSGSKATKG